MYCKLHTFRHSKLFLLQFATRTADSALYDHRRFKRRSSWFETLYKIDEIHVLKPRSRYGLEGRQSRML